MNRKIIGNRYLYRLIKRHVIYIIGFVLFSILASSFIPLQINKYGQLRKQSGLLDEELARLEQRRAVLTQYRNINIDELITLVNTIFPNTEDRFSIFGAMDNLEVITGVPITDYSSPFTGHAIDETVISAHGRANETAFMNFLKDYPYLSGRLITLDKINFNPKENLINFSIVFHTRDIPPSENLIPEYNATVVLQINALRDELEARNPAFAQNSREEEVIPINYSTKTNPFE
ncbi:hypothetical protein A3H80_03760 [Candidatus Roizmanbacteria bacterium RIFCSPLOWO2_02_FULL_37_19]|uniref:Uncharacterized protein n=1 Tax=Candidatus Roizmanbacteria bacterium RIFCSPHIGHO2_02_FULL_37_24 TaxID=1802037 RepID=A0A1F7GVS5_9BACT|nr:MAG: hypothetical protein A2862_01850 [Candidatus Roizmanbacteria bacterium RIFCSPHIGHO2_01_FULL_38_41]OGK22915.1 MAG: hypothetical protein A3C24_03580 [Candidatus Roizmanbacteria bacterium RIFCSPHIGHO2_02_FULL_37_24]OGK33631.1 MAG: hypothetical protein A3E10_05205 [Candidatus Roizmanbacteria bacterium RIFCSPHIGHO2_12_FULL_37_23]OGK44980.1 MAG: hypothetical protein A2956_00355 [Candidatus Roizmanbacteria bacterium RIFCSPLOWO2_01_FULL_37_57]OGK55283.1 MAG: hypothetical protein A3H80_03760 [Ca